MTNWSEDRQPSIVAAYETAKAAAHGLGFQLSVTRKEPAFFVLEAEDKTVLRVADIANIDAFLHGVQDARRRWGARRRRPRGGDVKTRAIRAN